MIKRKARSILVYQGHNFICLWVRTWTKIIYIHMVWCAHARVCGICMCVHVLMPVCRGQRRMFNLPHPTLPFNKESHWTWNSPPFFVQLGWLASKTVILRSCPFPTPSTGAVVLRGCGCATFYVAAGIQTQPFVLVQQALCPLSCLLSAWKWARIGLK